MINTQKRWTTKIASTVISTNSGSFGNLWLIKSFIFGLQKWLFVWSTRQSRTVVVYSNGPRRNLNWTVPNIVPGELHTLYYYYANQARALFPANWCAYTYDKIKRNFTAIYFGYKISLSSRLMGIIWSRSISTTYGQYTNTFAMRVRI